MDDEVKILYQQLFTSCLYIIVFIVFIILNYNNILKKLGRPYFFDDTEVKFIILMVNVFAFVLLLSYLYVNYKFYIEDDTLSNKLQFYVSILSIIGSIIVIYAVSISGDSNSVLNPEI